MSRTSDGRFGIGNAGGPGRPPRETEASYLETLRTTVTLSDWTAICERACSDAKAGNARAREWLTRHLIGEKALADGNGRGDLFFRLVQHVEEGRQARVIDSDWIERNLGLPLSEAELRATGSLPEEEAVDELTAEQATDHQDDW